MKLQDVILKAMAKKISWLEAAEIIGVCDRTMRRMRQQYVEFGYNGLFDQRRRKREYLRVPMETTERVLALYQETYFDLSVQHFDEKLREERAIELSHTWVKQTLQGAGLVARRKKRGSHRRRRPHRPLPGMLRREGGPASADAGGQSFKGTGCADESGLLTASAGPLRAQLLHLAEPLTAGVTACR